MVEEPIADVVKRYLRVLPSYGIHATRGVLYGSFARGDAHEWSDIDLIVIAPEFDRNRTIELVKQLWIARSAADNRIEPIACGEQEWLTDDGRPILEIARLEGIEIAA